MIIGLCGRSGCGKTTFANQLKTKLNNVYHLDIDKVGHEVLTFPEVKLELVNAFGEQVIVNGVADRKAIGKIVFNDPKQMEVLTAITWKYMEIYIDEFIKIHFNDLVILDWMLLPKSKFFKKCDIKILLDVPYEIRKERAMKRDDITEEAFNERDKAGLNYNKEDFDEVIIDGNVNKVLGKVMN